MPGPDQPQPDDSRPAEPGSQRPSEPTEPAAELRRLNRRRLLAWTGATGAGAAALVGAGYIGHQIPRRDAATEQNAAPGMPVGALRLVSRPDLTPAEVTVSGPQSAGGARDDAPGYFCIGPAEVPDPEQPTPQTGLMIIDRAGELVWFRPLDDHANDFRVQTYRGEPVLTWWQGLAGIGYGQGRCVIADTSYTEIATVQAVGDGLQADLHEFVITDRDTAYLTIYRTTTADLSAVGGASDGPVIAGVVQEIDIATGELLFEWDSLDHIDIAESDVALPEEADVAYDYFHVNSVYEVSDDELLFSARNTHAVYSVNKNSGAVNWTLGGKNSDFDQNDETRFHFQHDAKLVGSDRLMIFDNGSGPPAKAEESRTIVLRLDHNQKTVAQVRSYTHPSRLLADFMGNAHPLPSGHIVVGWGSQPYFSEFSRSGEITLQGKLPDSMMSYRITSHDWTGEPSEPPAIGLDTQKVRGVTVHASWNGATGVAGWQVYAGEQPDALKPVGGPVPATGFETAVSAGVDGPFFVAAALGATGDELGRSEVTEAKT